MTTAHGRQIRIAFADCFSGISGDMFLGALLDAGFPEDILRQQLALLPLEKYQLLVSKKNAGAISATSLTVEVSGAQPPREWKTIRRLIGDSGLPAEIREKSLSVFQLLAQTEAKVHGCSEDDVHFHELGGVDTLVDIVGSICGLAYFSIDHLVTSPLPMPRGWVSCEHGLLPLPAPAVCEILRQVPVYGTELTEELVTPTGAALVKALSREFGQFPGMVIENVGYGCGSRELPDHRPNLFRLVLGKKENVAECQLVQVIETNLDDWSPEGFPHLVDRLFARGALDVSLTSILMKKGRPGFLLRVISDPAVAGEIKTCILTETTAIGLRFRTEHRLTLPRAAGSVDTPWGPVQVKKVETPAGPVLYPEYEDCRRVASAFGIALKEVYGEIARHAAGEFREGG